MINQKKEHSRPLQLKVLLTLTEGPSFGLDLMKKLKIKSPGTIYPELKLLKSRGLIEIQAKTEKKKIYVLSEKGKQLLQQQLFDIGRKYFNVSVTPYLEPLIQMLDDTIKLTPELKILSNGGYEPTKQWLHHMDVTYQQFPEEPQGRYNLAILDLIGTLIHYGWKKKELYNYLSRIIESLEPESMMIMIEIERVKNMFANMYLQDVLGFTKVPGITDTELKKLIESIGLKVINIKKEQGLLIGFSTTQKKTK